MTPDNKIKLQEMVEAEITKKYPPEKFETAMKAYGIPQPKSIHDIPPGASAEICLGHRIENTNNDELIRIAGELGLDISDLLE